MPFLHPLHCVAPPSYQQGLLRCQLGMDLPSRSNALDLIPGPPATPADLPKTRKKEQAQIILLHAYKIA